MYNPTANIPTPARTPAPLPVSPPAPSLSFFPGLGRVVGSLKPTCAHVVLPSLVARPPHTPSVPGPGLQHPLEAVSRARAAAEGQRVVTVPGCGSQWSRD